PRPAGRGPRAPAPPQRTPRPGYPDQAPLPAHRGPRRLTPGPGDLPSGLLRRAARGRDRRPGRGRRAPVGAQGQRASARQGPVRGQGPHRATARRGSLFRRGTAGRSRPTRLGAAVRLWARKGSVRVRGRGRFGGKDRTVPLHAEVRSSVEAPLDDLGRPASGPLMGHSDINTTRRYALPTDADKAAALEALTVDR